MSSWCKITILPRGPERNPECTVQVRFSFHPAMIEAIKTAIIWQHRAYDEEGKMWYLREEYREPVFALAKAYFDEAALIEGNRTTDLITGRSYQQGDLFDGYTDHASEDPFRDM